MTRKLSGGLALLFTICIYAALENSAPVHAGTFVLSGDATPAFSLGTFDPARTNPGNQQFFANVLGAGTQVAMLATSLNTFDETLITDYYETLPGVGTTIVPDEINAATLAGVDLLILPAPENAFTGAEIQTIGLFLADDGVVLALGDSVTAARFGNGPINELLMTLASSMQINGDNLDIGSQTATGSQVLNHPLTAGVNSLDYGATASVTGGTPLFLANNGSPFVAVEFVVPEPASLGLLVCASLTFLTQVGRKHA